MIEFFYSYPQIVLFIHIVCAVVWIGSAVGFVVASYPAVNQIPNEKLMVRTSIRTLKRLYELNIFLSIVIGVTGFIISVAVSYSGKDPLLETILDTKKILWVFMFITILSIYYRVLTAKRKCLSNNPSGAKDNIRLISNYLIVINIFLGLVASYFGMMLRS